MDVFKLKERYVLKLSVQLQQTEMSYLINNKNDFQIMIRNSSKAEFPKQPIKILGQSLTFA